MRTARGFSLIEIMLVVVLIAAATAMAAYAMTSGLAGSQLRGAAREVAAQLRFTRAQARASRSTNSARFGRPVSASCSAP